MTPRPPMTFTGGDIAAALAVSRDPELVPDAEPVPEATPDADQDEETAVHRARKPTVSGMVSWSPVENRAARRARAKHKRRRR